MKLSKANIIEFWTTVKVVNPLDPDSCWECTCPTDMNGYAIYRGVLAHRIAAMAYMKPGFLMIPGKVTKKCKNRKCVRKEHIDNIYQASKSSLTNDKLKVYAARGDRRYSVKGIAEKLKIEQKAVRSILRESALYDIYKDIERYHLNNLPIPILPDIRKVEHAKAHSAT